MKKKKKKKQKRVPKGVKVIRSNNVIPGSRLFGLLSLAAALVIAALAHPAPVRAETGVTSDAIVFGQSACFTGPNRNLGLYYRAGILSAFEERNRAGGINGRTLRLLSLDDGYEPEQAAANAERFAAENDVFTVIGGVGTPTAKRIAPCYAAPASPLLVPSRVRISFAISTGSPMSSTCGRHTWTKS